MASYGMDDVEIRVTSYKGIGIDLRPLELQRSGWIADFALIEEIGSKTIVTPYAATVSFPTIETAKDAALDFAYSIIDEKH
jgi:hypothetical protein